MIANIEQEIKYFKKKLVRAINIFFCLKSMYENDEDVVLELIHEYKKYLRQFHEKYSNISIIIEEEDFTPDDLKIFLLGYTSVNQIKEKYSLTDCPLLIKVNKKYNKLQGFLNYKTLDENLSQDLEFLGMLAIENSNPDKKIILGDRLEKTGSMNNKYHGKDAVFITGSKY